MPAGLFQQCIACSWLNVLDSSNPFIMKFVIFFLATIFFGALGGKKNMLTVVAIVIDFSLLISLILVLWTLDSKCSGSVFNTLQPSYILFNVELLFFRNPCECYKAGNFSSIVNMTNNYLVLIVLLMLKMFPKFPNLFGQSVTCPSLYLNMRHLMLVNFYVIFKHLRGSVNCGSLSEDCFKNPRLCFNKFPIEN